MRPPLELTIEPVTIHTTVVHLAGELDAVSAGLLHACVSTVEPGSTRVILDLHELTFMDSMGIGVLVRLHRELDATCRILQIRNLRGHPQQVLEMTEVHRFLHLI